MEFSTARFLSDAGAERAHRFSYNVNGTGDDYQTPGSRDDTCAGQRSSDVGSLVDVDRDALGSLANLGSGRRARDGDAGGDYLDDLREENFTDIAHGLQANSFGTTHHRAYLQGRLDG